MHSGRLEGLEQRDEVIDMRLCIGLLLVLCSVCALRVIALRLGAIRSAKERINTGLWIPMEVRIQNKGIPKLNI